MNKENMIYLCLHTHTHTHTHTQEYYSSIMVNDITPFSGKWVKPWVIMLSEISQTQKER
jgi:hypothetical protein